MNMKRSAAIIIAIACAAMLCLALGACGGGGGGGAEASFPGKWNTIQVTQGSETIKYEDADDVIKSKMDDTYVVLNEDGTGTICDDGYNAEGTWKATSPTEATGTFEGMEFAFKLDGGNLSVSSGEVTLLMKKS